MPSTGIIFIALLSLILFGCSSPELVIKSTTLPHQDENSGSADVSSAIERIAYSIQIGAFSNPKNARRLEKTLLIRGFDAYSFRHESGLYKVRFGDFPTYEAARREAESLQDRGIIANFFIVPPPGNVILGIRLNLVETARRFLGVPYSWGGDSAEEGFDCSGLTMAVYRLNGLKLPRESARQFRAGRPVDRKDLKRGDLVFFSTADGRKVSHVGLYIAAGKFIHAPRPGKTVRISNLDSAYFREKYVGARSYL